MRSIITTNGGRVRTSYNGEQDGDGWVHVPDDEYIHPRNSPTGYSQDRYVISESDGLDFDKATEYMGAIHTAIVEIDAPEFIPNDGSEHDVTFVTEADETITVEIQIEDMTDTIDLVGEHTETITTTLDGGETISVVVDGDGVEATETAIEVVEA